jgi:hypothetical protein
MSTFATPRGLALALVALLSLALIVLLLLPAQLPNSRSIAARDLTWSLPNDVTVDADRAVSAIVERQLWGASASPGQPGPAFDETALTPPNWRLAGAFAQGAEHTTLLVTEGAPQPLALHVGDSLPGGVKILAIRSDRISLSLHGQRVSLSTYPQ